jgi:diguanylate cyclase (GGDEF)-like protein
LLRVLVVEGSPHAARVIEENLLRVRQRCYVVEWVPDVAVAAERLRDQNHDLCLVGWHIGEQTAADLLEIIREEGIEIPVLVVMASPTEETKERAYTLGAAGLISRKSLNPETLDCAIREAQNRELVVTTTPELARYDGLTGLATLQRLKGFLGRALEEARRNEQWEVALLHINLDRFSEINQALGRASGDRALQAVARRLRQGLRPRDLVARLDGDVFGVLFQGFQASTTALRAKARLQEMLDQPMSMDGTEFYLGASFGMSADASGTGTVASMLADAAQEMAEDKTCRRERGPTLLRLQNSLSFVAALERGEFRLEYQPLLDASTGWVLGMEALVRWVHPHQGVLRPGAFFGLAEQAGFMGPLGRWVLDTACRDLAAWQRDFGSLVPGLRLNLSDCQFADESLPGSLARALENYQLNPHHLVLEINEAALEGDSEEVVDRIKAIRSTGVRVCVDGFGRQGMRLATLADFQLDEIKLAPDLTRGLAVEPRRAIVIEGLLGICRRLGIEVTAKNVETERQAQELLRLRCQRQQGNWHRKEMGQVRVAEYLEDRYVTTTGVS